ncbi:MAG TPA: hypothetical protein VMY39_06585 [Planctomycetota bacterium]|nr:hypothetical protein [Planctomycetota bacterium]
MSEDRGLERWAQDEFLEWWHMRGREAFLSRYPQPGAARAAQADRVIGYPASKAGFACGVEVERVRILGIFAVLGLTGRISDGLTAEALWEIVRVPIVVSVEQVDESQDMTILNQQVMRWESTPHSG